MEKLGQHVDLIGSVCDQNEKAAFSLGYRIKLRTRQRDVVDAYQSFDV